MGHLTLEQILLFSFRTRANGRGPLTKTRKDGEVRVLGSVHISSPGLVNWSGVNVDILPDELFVEIIHVFDDHVDHATRNPIAGKRGDVEPDTVALKPM